MRITIVTPLFPPDVEEPAPQVKELATRLTAGGHHTTVLLYGRLPESVQDVRMIAVDKRTPRFLRLLNFTWALGRCARTSDLLFVENGPSVELPLFVVAHLLRIPYLIHEGDPRAAARSNAARGVRAWLARRIRARAIDVVIDMPPARPEILPFAPYPRAAFESYEHAWSKYLARLTPLFTHDAQ